MSRSDGFSDISSVVSDFSIIEASDPEVYRAMALLENAESIEEANKSFDELINLATQDNGQDKEEAQYLLYQYNRNGYEHRVPDLWRAKYYLIAAANNDYVYAQIELLGIYYSGDSELGIAADRDAANQLLVRMNEVNPNIFFDFPDFLISKSPLTKVDSFWRPQLWTYIGNCIQQGLCGFSISEDSQYYAYKYFNKAAEEGHLAAIYQKAIYHYEGLGEAVEDPAFSIEEMYRLAEFQSPDNDESDIEIVSAAKAFLRPIMRLDISRFVNDIVAQYLRVQAENFLFDFNRLFSVLPAKRAELTEKLLNLFFEPRVIRIDHNTLADLKRTLLSDISKGVSMETHFIESCNLWKRRGLTVVIPDSKEDKIDTVLLN